MEREETQKIHFVKIHAPKKVLCRYCEILKIKLPMKKVRELNVKYEIYNENCSNNYNFLQIQDQDDILAPEFELMQSMKSFFGKPFEFVKLDPNLFPEAEYKLFHVYSQNHKYL